MKKAIITTGGKQYIVSEGQSVDVELIKTDKKKVILDALLVIEGDKVTVGKPTVDGVKVSATITVEDEQQPKVTSIRYKAKKRVHTVRGHRQRLTTLKIDSIK